MKKLQMILALSPLVLMAATDGDDSWKEAATKQTQKEFVFAGNFRVVAVTRRENSLESRHHLELYDDGKRVAALPGVRIDTLAASPGGDVFVGFASGFLEGDTAVIIFGRDGSVLLSVSHAVAEFEHCPPDGSRKLKWYDEDDPSIRFDQGFISFKGCRGERVALLKVVAGAIERQSARFAR